MEQEEVEVQLLWSRRGGSAIHVVMLGIVLCTTGAPRTRFCTIDASARTAGQMKKQEKWAGEAAVGTKIYFAPLVQAAVGVLDRRPPPSRPSARLASRPATQQIWVQRQWVQKVFFGPHDEDNVGVLDITSSTFSTIGTAAADVVGNRKYSGAATVHDKIYFTPFRQDNIGVLDTTSSTFSTISITVSGTQKYYGAAAVGSTVIFPPFTQDNVGVLDTSSSVPTFSTIPMAKEPDALFGGLGGWYAGAAVLGTKVYMAPYSADIGPR